MPTKRVCPEPGCPVLTDSGRCDEHRKATDRARGTRQQRGYDSHHDRTRAHWAPQVATGTIRCWRCHRPITPNDPWHLGHSDDRTRHNGPEHALCNLSAAGRSSHPGG